jgi:hypothetical protein
VYLRFVNRTAGGLALALHVFAFRAGAAELRWSAPAECPDRRDVEHEVGRLVGYPLQASDSADFTIEIVEKEPGFELTLRREEKGSGERRTRTLSGRTCSEVADAAAVAIAMALQGNDTGEEAAQWQTAPADQPQVLPQTGARTPTRGRAENVARDRGPRSGAEPSPFHVMGGAAGVVDFGALPQAAPGVELDLAAGYRKLRLTAFGALFAAVDATASQGGGGEFRLWTAGVLTCFDEPLRGYTLSGCGGFELGRMNGRGIGVSASRERSARWQAARLEMGVTLPAVGPLAVAIRAAAVLPLYRPEFVLDGTEVVHRAAPVTGRFLVGLEIHP